MFRICLLLVLLALAESYSEDNCESRLHLLEDGQRCLKPCKRDSECRGVRKTCNCDDVCGMICFNLKAPCPVLSIDNGDIGYSKSDRSYNTIATYGCRNGYYLEGPRRRTCRSDRMWTETQPHCKRGCHFPAVFDTTFPTNIVTEFPIGSKVTYECDAGHNSIGNPIVTCGENLEWTELALECLIKTCPPPVLSNTYKIVGKKRTFGSKIYYECVKGYEMEPGVRNYRFCSWTSQWSGFAPTCTIKRCSAPVPPEHGQLDDRNVNYEYGSEITFSCDFGYKNDGNESAFCNEHALWQGTARCVVDLECNFEEYQQPLCGYRNLDGSFWERSAVSGSPDFVAQSYTTNEQIMESIPFSFDSDKCIQFRYKLFSKNSILSIRLGYTNSWHLPPYQSRRTWTRGELTIPALYSGTISIVASGGTVNIDDIELLEGRCLDECSSNPCENNGKCIDLVQKFHCDCTIDFGGPTCARDIKCPAPRTQLEYGNVQVTYLRNAEGYPIEGTKIQFTCDYGYKLSRYPTKDSIEVTCLYTFQWSLNQHNIQCIEKKCNRLQQLANGRSISQHIDQPFKVGAIVDFSCSNGFSLEGYSSLRCNNNEQWNHLQPTCREILTTTRPTNTRAETATSRHVAVASTPVFWKQWSAWHQWGPCYNDFGNQKRKRYRDCIGSEPFILECKGDYFEEKNCNASEDFRSFSHNGKDYTISSVKLDYEGAIRACQEFRGKLVDLREKIDHNYVANKLTTILSGRFSVWTGLNSVRTGWSWDGRTSVVSIEERRFNAWSQTNYHKQYNKCAALENMQTCKIWTGKRNWGRKVYQYLEACWVKENCSSRKYFLCERASSICSIKSCRNGGTCQDERCICRPGYTGPSCAVIENYCQTLPCLNGATCDSSYSPTSFTCVCRDGFYGRTCKEEYKCSLHDLPSNIDALNGENILLEKTAEISFLDDVKFVCKDQRLRIIGSHISKCSSGGDWTPPLPNPCVYICNKLGNPEQGNITYTPNEKHLQIGTIASVTCNNNYKAENEKLLCTPIGWSGQPNCLKKLTPCYVPIVYLNDGVTPQKKRSHYQPGQKLKFGCSMRYHDIISKVGSRLTCGPNGKWDVNPLALRCYKRCKGLRAPPHGQLTYSTRKRTHGTSVIVTCDQGFIPSSNVTAVCSHGQWSGSLLTCIDTRPASTAIPPTTTFTTITTTTVAPTTTFTTTTTTTVAPTTSGVRCTVIRSELKPGVQLRGYYKSSRAVLEFYSNRRVVFMCEDKTKDIEGNPTVSCGENGTWGYDYRNFNCNSRCPGLAEPENGRLEFRSGKRGKWKHGTEVQAVCYGDLRPAFPGTALCNNGRWLPGIPRCEEPLPSIPKASAPSNVTPENASESCARRCRTARNQQLSCQCDSSCRTRDDCCSDYLSVCK